MSYRTKASLDSLVCVCAITFMVVAGLTSHANNLGNQILFTDSQGAILKADIASGLSSLVAQGQRLVQPLGIAVGRSGDVFITDTGCGSVIEFNPKNGKQRVVSSGGILGVPFGIAVQQNGNLLIANAQNLVRVEPRTGAKTIVSSGQYFRAPIAVSVAEDGWVYVVDGLGAVIRVNPVTGEQMLVTSGNFLNRPQGIVVTGADIYVTDVATPDGNFGVGRIVHIDAQTGQQEVLSEGQNLVGPVGITLDGDGWLIVGDPYTIDQDSVNLFDGAIISVDPATGNQELIARGHGEFVNPRCVALVQTHSGR